MEYQKEGGGIFPHLDGPQQDWGGGIHKQSGVLGSHEASSIETQVLVLSIVKMYGLGHTGE